MRRLGVFAFVLLAGLGCATEDTKKQWDDALRDLRGDNLEMKSDGSAIGGWGINNHN